MKNISTENEQWFFDNDVAKIFEEHIRKSVPLYDELHNMIAYQAQFFIKSKSVVCDIGTSSGETIIRLENRYANKNLVFYGIDSSHSMIIKATQRCKSINSVNLLNIKVQDFRFPQCDFIACVYTLQFIDPNERFNIVKKIYDALKPGGCFILAEKIKTFQKSIHNIYTEHHNEMKLNYGFTKEEIEGKKRRLEGVLLPLTLTNNLDMIKLSGFNTKDVFFKWCNFVGIIAIK